MSAKINPLRIVKAHLATLRNDKDDKVSFFDWTVFYGLPIAAGITISLLGQRVTNDVFTGSASIFGIFVGLLLNVQVAIFSISLRKPVELEDEAAQRVVEHQLTKRRIVLQELNANVAYLIVVSIFGIVASLVFLGVAKNSAIYTGILTLLYVHIVLNVLMTVKRAFLLFDAEYENG